MSHHTAAGAVSFANTRTTRPGSLIGSLAAGADRLLGGVVEAIAAALVAAEIVVLFTGVVSRYAFHSPLTWSDELAAILFIWLSMLGAVVALRRGEHMRMTALVQKVTPATRALLDAFAIAFLVLIMWPTLDYAHEQTFIATPALEINDAWRAGAIPAGAALMLAIALLRLLRVCSGRQIAASLLGVGGLVAAFWFAAPLFATLGKLNLIVFFVVVVAATVLSGVPIAFSFALSTFGYLALTTPTPLLVMVGRLDEGMSHLILLAVPLFIFLGALIEMTGISIAALFTGGLLPAVVLGIGLCTVVWWRYRREDLSGVQRLRKRAIGKLLLLALPAVLLPFVIRAAVVEGVATATEVSTIGIVYSAIVGLVVYHQFDWRRLKPMLVDTASLSGAIIFIVGCATATAWGLTQSGFSQDLAHAMGSLPGGSYGFLAVSIVAFIVLGSMLEGIPAIVLFGPLLFPIARAAGIDEVHYAMVVIFAMGIGLFAPPFGVGYYGACAVSKVDPDEGIRHIGGYIVAMLIGLAVVALVPWFSTGFLKT